MAAGRAVGAAEPCPEAKGAAKVAAAEVGVWVAVREVAAAEVARVAATAARTEGVAMVEGAAAAAE